MALSYQRNNIIFRIASSDAIAKFKSIQAHTLIQVARPDLHFDECTREAVLLEYDRLTQWVLRVERLLLRNHDHYLNEGGVKALIHNLSDELHGTEDIIDEHPEVFSIGVSQYVKLIHGYSFKQLNEEITGAFRETTERAFSSMCDTLARYAQSFLSSLHEFNNNLIVKQDPPFISICEGDPIQEEVSAARQRCAFFLNQGTEREFVLKSYTTDATLIDEVTTALVESGVSVSLDPQQEG
jgi:hypothetical protein